MCNFPFSLSVLLAREERRQRQKEVSAGPSLILKQSLQWEGRAFQICPLQLKKKVPVDRKGYEHDPGVKKKKKLHFFKGKLSKKKKKKFNRDILMVPVRLEEGLRISLDT